MNKTIVTAVAVGLVAMAASAVTTSASEPEVLWYFDTPDGIVTVAEGEFDQTCTAQAAGLLGDFYCNNGDHVRTALFFGHGCRAQADYTGTMESILAHDGDNRHFQCTYENGAITAVNGFGAFPGLGAELRHDCWSYEVGTAQDTPLIPGLGTVLTGGEAQTDPHGVPGGVGTWGCELLN